MVIFMTRREHRRETFLAKANRIVGRYTRATIYSTEAKLLDIVETGQCVGS